MNKANDIRRIPDPAGEVRREFQSRFGGVPRVFRAPGRINIIGDHTDHVGGWVAPAAINRSCAAAVAPNGRGIFRAASLNRTGSDRVEVFDLAPRFERHGDWRDYVAGVIAALADAGISPPPSDILVGGDVPEGAGLSSSAALEVSVAAALIALSGETVEPMRLASIARSAEATYVGMPCGLMDQFIAVHGQAGRAVILDCLTLTFTPTPIPPGLAFLVIDSGVRHQLVDGGYAQRRAECEEAQRRLGIDWLALAPTDLPPSALPPTLYRRTRHVVSETARVRLAAEALARSDGAELGRLMSASHASLRDDFEVTCQQTDILAAIAQETPDVLGARQMGGGFGGVVIALVPGSAAEVAGRAIAAGYRDATGLEAASFVCETAGGVHEVGG
ncbi:galactokinase [bacterium]|nr:galactokinase [bacterium]